MRRFMYFSISVLCLSISALIGFHLGSNSARADDVSDSGITAVAPYAPGGLYAVFDTAGEIWFLSSGDAEVGARCWDQDPSLLTTYPELAPPVPVSTIKFWKQNLLVTKDNQAWVRDNTIHSWSSCGPWPGGPVPTSPSTWGGVKGKYEGEK